MANRERHLLVGEEVHLPAGANFVDFCQELEQENVDYNDLSPDKVEKVGTHTSIVLHDYSDGTGRWASIHYRENLGQLAEIEGQLEKGKVFLRNISVDLHLLAQRLHEDLEDVQLIYGLTHLSTTWGNRHGFTTKEFSADPGKLMSHLKAISALPTQLNRQDRLSLFVIDRNTFIREFYKEPKNLEASVSGVVIS